MDLPVARHMDRRATEVVRVSQDGEADALLLEAHFDLALHYRR